METLSRSKNNSWLPWFLRGVLLLSFLILFARLADLQLIRGAYYKNMAEDNRIRMVKHNAPRGRILDRNGEVIVGNIDIKKRVIFDPNEGYSITTNIEGAFEQDIITDPMRVYKYGAVTGHLTGYLGEANVDEVGRVNAECIDKGAVSLGEFIGRGGLEQFYNCKLTGVAGEEMVEVDAQGNKIRRLGVREPIPGEDLKTNIDIGLQKKVADLMQDQPGAVIVSDGKNRILSLYSSPSFDPNAFIHSKETENIKRIINDESMPLFNRAIAGKYPPGSVFKPLISIAALEENKVNKDFTHNDIGYIAIDEFLYRNWYYTQYGGTEGQIGFVRAIARSTDTFFYKLGEHTGIGNIEKWGDIFGLNRRTGIDLPGETEGIMPGREWKLENKGEPWYLGNTYHLSIGQGDLSSTPVEIHKANLAIANEGEFCVPKIVGEPDCIDLEFDQENVDIVKEGMVAACSDGGTAFTFFDYPKIDGKPTIACKTGTAETGLDNETHAWLVAFSPIVDPEIVVTVLVERGGEGSYDAGPIAREIFNYWFDIPSQPTPTQSDNLTPTPREDLTTTVDPS